MPSTPTRMRRRRHPIVYLPCRSLLAVPQLLDPRSSWCSSSTPSSSPMIDFSFISAPSSLRIETKMLQSTMRHLLVLLLALGSPATAAWPPRETSPAELNAQLASGWSPLPTEAPKALFGRMELLPRQAENTIDNKTCGYVSSNGGEPLPMRGSPLNRQQRLTGDAITSSRLHLYPAGRNLQLLGRLHRMLRQEPDVQDYSNPLSGLQCFEGRRMQ